MVGHGPDGSLRFVTLRLAALLAATVILEALVLCCALGAGGLRLPLSRPAPVHILPQLLGGLSLVLAIVTAPLLAIGGQGGQAECAAGSSVSMSVRLGRAAFAAACQAAALGFMLLAVARLAPITGSCILQAVVWLALFALASVLLAELAPRAFAGLMFLWVVALPVGGYMLAEVFLSSPNGAAGWGQAAGAPAAALRALLHWSLSLSPLTALDGALAGTLADETEWAWGAPFALMCILNGLLAWRLARQRRTTSAIAPAGPRSGGQSA